MKILFLTSILIIVSNYVEAIPINITYVSDLNFGPIIAGSSTKTIPPGSSDNGDNASFTVTGDPNTSYNIALPSSITILKNGTGPESLVVNSITSNPSNVGLLSPSGSQLLLIGGSLNVPIATTRGDYTGVFTVDVVY